MSLVGAERISYRRFRLKRRLRGICSLIWFTPTNAHLDLHSPFPMCAGTFNIDFNSQWKYNSHTYVLTSAKIHPLSLIFINVVSSCLYSVCHKCCSQLFYPSVLFSALSVLYISLDANKTSRLLKGWFMQKIKLLSCLVFFFCWSFVI